MPRTLQVAFDQFHTSLKPNSTARDAAKGHRASVLASLEKIYTINYFFQSGSSGNSTDIIYYSDIDYMALIPEKQLTSNSTTMLTKVRDQLNYTFPKSNVHVSTPAVVVPFGLYGVETNEVVPGYLIEFTKSGIPVYGIADGNGGWIKTAPKAHNAYVTEVNTTYNYEVKTFIRFIKAWKYYNVVDISSFYLEMRAAKYAETYFKKGTVASYVVHLHYYFKDLYSINLAQLQDPTGIVGYIAACNSEYKKTAALSKIHTAMVRSEKAMNATIGGNFKDAFYWLNLLFNNKFPNYNY